MDCTDFDYCFKCKQSSNITHPEHEFVLNPTKFQDQFLPFCDNCLMVGKFSNAEKALMANVSRTYTGRATSVLTIRGWITAWNACLIGNPLIWATSLSKIQRLLSFENTGGHMMRQTLGKSTLLMSQRELASHWHGDRR